MNVPVDSPSLYNRIVGIAFNPNHNCMNYLTSDGQVWTKNYAGEWEVSVRRAQYQDMDRLTDSGRKE